MDAILHRQLAHLIQNLVYTSVNFIEELEIVDQKTWYFLLLVLLNNRVIHDSRHDPDLLPCLQY